MVVCENRRKELYYRGTSFVIANFDQGQDSSNCEPTALLTVVDYKNLEST